MAGHCGFWETCLYKSSSRCLIERTTASDSLTLAHIPWTVPPQKRLQSTKPSGLDGLLTPHSKLYCQTKKNYFILCITNDATHSLLCVKLIKKKRSDGSSDVCLSLFVETELRFARMLFAFAIAPVALALVRMIAGATVGSITGLCAAACRSRGRLRLTLVADAPVTLALVFMAARATVRFGRGVASSWGWGRCRGWCRSGRSRAGAGHVPVI